MVASRYLFNNIEFNDKIKEISQNFEKYYVLFRDITESPIGKYSIYQILEAVEEALNYIEIFSPIIKNWIQDYLDEHRGKLWLFYGITKGNHLTDYWNIRETNFSELIPIWPFLFNRDNPNYKDFIIDLRDAQSEVLRQRERQSTSNPKYKVFHPDGCSCWMLDDMEQWYTEEQEEIKVSRNIFFNGNLQRDFYKVAIQDLEELKEQWGNWVPPKPDSKVFDTDLKLISGQTPIKLVISWIKSDFYYSHILSMFHWSDTFQEIWDNIDSAENFVNCQRQKLKKIVDLL